MLIGASSIEVREIPLEPLLRGQIRVRIESATTCGTDLKTFLRGGHPKIIKSLPSPFGHEMAGTVVEIAPDVSGFVMGDRVVVANSAPCLTCFYCKREKYNLCDNIQFINGAFSQYLVVPRDFVQTNVHKIPSSLHMSQASLAEPLACVMHAVSNLDIKPSQSAVLIGTGPMAFLFLQVLKAKQVRTILIGRNEARLKLAQQHGADHTLNSSTGVDLMAAVKNLTEGQGCDVAIDAAGQPATWKQAVDLVCRGGKVCFYGGCAKGTTVEFDTYRLHYDEITFMGVFHYTPAIMRSAIETLARGDIDTTLFVSERRTLDDVGAIYSGQDANPHALKYLIDPHAERKFK